MLASYTNVFPSIFSLIILICNLNPTSLAGILKSAYALLELTGSMTNTRYHDIVATAWEIIL